MTPLLVATIISCCVFGGALVGLALHARLPEHHLDARSKDVVTLVMGLIATVSALVLSLLIASAHDSFNTQEREVQQLSAHVIQLDRFLARHGPETRDGRDLLRRLVAEDIPLIWPADRAQPESRARTPGIAGAIFLVLEMSRPYSGLMAISSAPMRSALDHIGR